MFYCNKTVGHSMDYCILEGDALLYTDDVKYSFGDIVLYRNPETDEIVGHRFFAKVGNIHLIAGDNCKCFEFIHGKYLLGRGVMLIRAGKQRYDISTKSDFRTEYTRFLITYIIMAFFFFRIFRTKVFEKSFYRRIVRRNKMQVKYMDLCRLETVNGLEK